MAWYAAVDAELEHSGEPVPDVFKWLRPKFEEWAVSVSREQERARFLEANRGR
jgi:hypothetical protein